MISKEKIKYFNSLKIKKNRLSQKKIILEGERLIFEFLKTNLEINYLLVEKNYSLSKIGTKIIEKAKKNNITIEKTDNQIIKQLSSTKNNQSFIAICDMPTYKQLDYNQNILALDHISDPGNLGTLLRTAEWFGIQNILLSEDCVDIFNPKVIRSGMGAHFYLNSIYKGSLSNKLFNLQNMGYSILGADKNGSPLSKLNLKGKWVLIIGNEANGLSLNIKNSITDLISIPGKGNIESLNAAVAGSILLNTLIQ